MRRGNLGPGEANSDLGRAKICSSLCRKSREDTKGSAREWNAPPVGFEPDPLR